MNAITVSLPTKPNLISLISSIPPVSFPNPKSPVPLPFLIFLPLYYSLNLISLSLTYYGERFFLKLYS